MKHRNVYEVYSENAKNFVNCRCNRIMEGVGRDPQGLSEPKSWTCTGQPQEPHLVPENKTEHLQEQEKFCAQNFRITLLVH